jgi:hypothetical protein
MTVNKSFSLLILTGTLFLSGCTTYYRVVSDPELGSDPNLKSTAGIFYLAELKLKSNGTDPQATVVDMDSQQRFLPMLRKECQKRYPALFSETATGSIPLLIEVATIKFAMSRPKLQGFMYSYETEEESLVRVSVWTGRKDLRGEVIETKMRREEHTRKWTSLNVNVQALVDIELQKRAPQGATIIAQLIAAKDPAFWTAQPRWADLSNTQPGSPGGQPSALPPLETTVTPF